MTTEPREPARVWQPTGVVSLRLIGARPLTPTPTDVDETLAHWPPGFKERKQAIADDVARERGHRV